MMQPTDLAKKFILIAQRDFHTFEVLVEDKTIADETVGFHAQQVVEKCLKALLTMHGVEFRKIHDLSSLLEILQAQHGPC
jgi:HEPN domain-containing protein